MFRQVAALSQRRSELAQQLIALQENTFRSISRELHDEFGQILTAIGAMLQRAGRRIPAMDAPLRTDMKEVQEIVQSTLDKVRTLSQALHPAVLEEAGLEVALRQHLPVFEKQTGIQIAYESSGSGPELDQTAAIHLYRVLQEALNNVARHSQAARAAVRLRYSAECVVLEVEDRGVGFDERGPGSRDGAGFHARTGGAGAWAAGAAESGRRRAAGATDGSPGSSSACRAALVN